MKTKQVTKSDLARHWGLTRQAVTALFSHEGAPRFSESGKIPLEVAEEYRKARAESRQNPAAGTWRAELDRLKCALAEVELAKTEGKLIASDEVIRIAQEDAAAIRTAMLGMANALAPQLVGQSSPEAVRAILDDWARATLQGWHDSLSGLQKEGLIDG
jgi:hypothetical protein